jgi:hypothetical protein
MADRYWGENIFSEYSVSGVLAASLLFSALIRTLAAKATQKKYAFTPRCQTSDRKVIDPKIKMLKNFICRSSFKIRVSLLFNKYDKQLFRAVHTLDWCRLDVCG